jgi:leucyl-tRNA---protein transferase
MNFDVNEYFEREEISLDTWEMLLLNGWDRVGNVFFRRRYAYTPLGEFIDDREIYWRKELMPLRYELSDNFQFSKSQRMLQRRNADLCCVARPAFIDEEKWMLFERWYAARFKIEASIFSWVSGTDKPFPTFEICIYKADKLVACSFFDVTASLQYSTLAMYEPEEAKRSLGIYTLMCEIQHGFKHQKHYHYPGHAYYESSMYDYKKRFSTAEGLEWQSQTWKKIQVNSQLTSPIFNIK